MGAKEKPKTEKKRRPLLRRILLMLLAVAVLSALFFVFRSRFAETALVFSCWGAKEPAAVQRFEIYELAEDNRAEKH